MSHRPLSYETRHPSYKRYAPCRAHAQSCERKTEANMHERMKNEFIRLNVRVGLAQRWSLRDLRTLTDRLSWAGHHHEAIYQDI